MIITKGFQNNIITRGYGEGSISLVLWREVIRFIARVIKNISFEVEI